MPGLTMSAVTDAPHRLLLSHFTTWLRAKNREVDVPLLESLLDLRAMYDDLEPTLWPAGSVQDLLLRLLPAKGPTDPLSSDAVVDALDAYFGFCATPAACRLGPRHRRISPRKLVAAPRG